MSDPSRIDFVIAIDGPAASGKGTIARRLADRYGASHLDTGLLYRGVAAAVLAEDGALEEEAVAARAARALRAEALENPALRTAAMGRAASIVAAHPAVRAALLQMQRSFAAQPGGAVIDGRDIGSVVCPQARVKLFVTASVAERARRRAQELRARGEPASETDIRSALEARDKRDSERAASPLIVPDGAHLLDTTELDIERAVEAAAAIVKRAAT